VARQVEHPLRNDAAVGDDEDGVGRDSFKLGAQLGVVLKLVGLEDSDSVEMGRLFDRRSLELLVAANGAVRLRDDERNLMTGSDDGIERRDSELWGSAEDESHTFYAIRLPQV